VKITGLEVDGFGVWSRLKLGPLSEGLNVFFGPNEAGKTTLMQFVRSVLYGFTPARRRYLPPVHGGRPGGAVRVVGPNGRFLVSRYKSEEDPDAADEVSLEAPDGTRQGGHLLKVLLANVDEAIFNNVFAVGLDELQELGTLDDTEAASLLYSLSAGLDRVALVDVLRELERSRNRLLSADGQPCLVAQLLAEREKLRAELGQLDELTHRYLRLAAEREQLEQQTARLEEEANQLRHDARMLEIAAVIGDRWERRKKLDDRLRALGPVDTLPEGAIEQFAAVNTALAKGSARMSQLREAWGQLRAEAAELETNKALWRLAPRIEAIAEQASWIGTLQTRTSELETEITDLEAQLSAEHGRLGLGKTPGSGAIPSMPAHSLRVLRGPARELRQCRQQLQEAEAQVATASQTARSLTDQIEGALSARDEADLAEAMDRVGGLVAQLRRRVQLDQRLDQMERHQVELEEESRDLLQRQVLPAGLLMALGGVFVASVMMILAGLAGVLVSQSIVGSFAWPLALLGLAGLGAAVAAKFLLERSNARRLEGCHKQIRMLQLQIKEARQERRTLDEQLSISDASVAGRLGSAEEDLAQLEDLVPLDARRKAAEQEAKAAEGRARQLRGELDAARRRWQQALHTLGLPTRLSPKQVRDLASGSTQIGELQRRLEGRYEEYEARRRELESLTDRIAQLASEANLPIQSEDPVAQVQALAQRWSEEEVRLKRREALRARARQLRRKKAKYERSIRRLKFRRGEILRQAGAHDEQTFRERAAEVARAEEIRRQRDSLKREIDAAIAGHCPEEAIAEQLEGDRAQHIEGRYEQLAKRLDGVEAKLQERFERRGTLGEQLRALADDRRPAAMQFELSLVDGRLAEAIHRWRVLAVTSRILRAIRTSYEQERQPETLQEASGYLERLTEGRYLRVWTPLDRDVLLVDDAHGRSLSIEVLSRGVREQLFLALRLALASSFARRGARLPLVLDDVLVNFDGPRAKAAVAVLRDFAEAGHQVLVFTCHEHIVKLFRSARLKVNELPHCGGLGDSAPSPPKPVKKRRKATAAPKPASTPVPKPAAKPAPAPEPLELPHKLVAASDGGDRIDEPEKPAAEEVEPGEEAEREEHVAFPGYYDDQGSYDDRGVEIANHFAAGDEDEQDDQEEAEEDDYDYDDEEVYDEEEDDHDEGEHEAPYDAEDDDEDEEDESYDEDELEDYEDEDDYDDRDDAEAA